MRSAALASARALMSEQNMDGLLVTSAINRFYLSEFSAGDHGPSLPDGILLIGHDDLEILFTGRNELDWAREESGCRDVRLMTQPWTGVLAAEIAELGWNRVGAEDAALSYSAWNDLSATLPADTQLIALGDQLARLRAVKDAAEIAELREAIRLTDIAFADAIPQFQIGMTEAAAASLVRMAILRAGADEDAFAPIVASGANAARPHHRPGDRQLGKSEPIIIDMGARIRGYNGDLTRTIVLGEPDHQFRSLYNLVLLAQEEALHGIAPKMSGIEADKIARDVIGNGCYRDEFLHSLGHGLGIEVHESPRLSAKSTDTLAPGHVVTVEPGIYIDGWGGVRIEDVVVLTDSGNENMTNSVKGLRQAVHAGDAK